MIVAFLSSAYRGGEVFIFPGEDAAHQRRNSMENRVAVLAIIVKEGESVAPLNDLLH